MWTILTTSCRTRPRSIAIEINPVDASGSATKKMGVVIRSTSELSVVWVIKTKKVQASW